MVNSASQSLAEFKSQRMGGLLSGTASVVGTKSLLGDSLSDSASTRLARSAPKKSSTAFLDSIRASGERMHTSRMAGYQAQAARKAQSAQSSGYSLAGMGSGGNGAGGARGQYGLTVPAAAAFNKMSQAYAQRWGGGLTVNSGGRTFQEQQVAYQKYLNGGPLAAKPGTSLHESGIAVDIGGPITNSGSSQHAWLRQNAAQFGWYWVGQRYGEPWHWEYHPGGVR